MEMVNNVTAERVYDAVGRMFNRSKGTLVIAGGNVSAVDSLTNMETALRSSS